MKEVPWSYCGRMIQQKRETAKPLFPPLAFQMKKAILLPVSNHCHVSWNLTSPPTPAASPSKSSGFLQKPPSHALQGEKSHVHPPQNPPSCSLHLLLTSCSALCMLSALVRCSASLGDSFPIPGKGPSVIIHGSEFPAMLEETFWLMPTWWPGMMPRAKNCGENGIRSNLFFFFSITLVIVLFVALTMNSKLIPQY